MPAGGDNGQASVALIATVPALLLVVAVIAQLVLVGGSAVSAATAARAAARTAYVGGSPERAARRALPAPLRERVRLLDGEDGAATVELRVPRLLPLLPRLPLRASARVGPEAGDG